MRPPRAVLIWRFSSVGDIVLTAPAVTSLAQAWPNTRIIYATKAAFAPLLEAHPDIDNLVPCQPDWSFRQLRHTLLEQGADAICDLHGKARGFVLRYSLGAKRKSVWSKRSLDQSLSMRLGHGRYMARQHIAARYHKAIEALVGCPLPKSPLRYYVGASDEQDAAALLDAYAPPTHGPRIGISPGAMWATKRWPLSRFIHLAQRLVAAGMQVLLTGSPSETRQAAEVVAQVPGAHDLTGQLSLGMLGGVIGACDVFIANDSGPMHIARALGVPTLAFFGSTDPHQFDGCGHRLVWSARNCAPCSFHGYAQCPRGHLGCLTDISVGHALAQVQALLGTKPVPWVYG